MYAPTNRLEIKNHKVLTTGRIVSLSSGVKRLILRLPSGNRFFFSAFPFISRYLYKHESADTIESEK